MCHVVWDWNGTLLDDLEAVVAAVNVSLAMLGEQPIDEAEYRRHYTRPVRHFYESLLGRAVGDAEVGEIDAVFHEAYRPLAERLTLGADARAAVESARAAGATQSVLSMWQHDGLEAAVHRTGLADYVVAVDGIRGGAPGREKAGHLAEHLERLAVLVPSLEREAIVMVGDITDDADAAAAARISCVLYDGGSQPKSVLQQCGVPVAATLVEALELAGIR